MTITLAQMALYAGALFVLFLTPGPVWLALTARTLAHGARGAFPLMLGVALGDTAWSVLALAGLAWIVASYDWVMEALRWLAVVVFAGMGVMLIRHSSHQISANSRLNRKGVWSGFIAGVAVILANPKAILFYIGMLPGFFDLSTITATDIALIGAISMFVPLVGNTFFALFVDRARRLVTNPVALTRINKIAGGLLILVAIAIAVFNR
ncbi:LysE family transporter [Rhodobacterales bacterium LSUCC0246]|nr:LysE family transporter [Rhodobacterales bacterium LSUCC0374]